MTQEAKLKVVCFFAHPDDEAFGSGGTLAELVLKGHHVTTVCATNGDVGEISDPSLATRENLWKVRQNELRSAMEITGVPDCLLYTSPSPRDGLLSRMPSSA